jgi:hypothetical protein
LWATIPAGQMTGFLGFDSFEIRSGGHFYAEDFSSFDSLDFKQKLG